MKSLLAVLAIACLLMYQPSWANTNLNQSAKTPEAVNSSDLDGIVYYGFVEGQGINPKLARQDCMNQIMAIIAMHSAQGWILVDFVILDEGEGEDSGEYFIEFELYFEAPAE